MKTTKILLLSLFTLLFFTSSKAQDVQVKSKADNINAILKHLQNLKSQNLNLTFNHVVQGDLSEEQAVFFQAFQEAYKDISHEEMFGTNSRWKDLDELLSVSWQEVQDEIDKKNPNFYLVTASLNKNCIGLAVFSKTDKPGEAYIDQMAILPEYWGQGVATNLFLLIFRFLPETNRIVFVTRKINQAVLDIAQNHGFTASDYSHAGYDPNVYQGFEYNVPNEVLKNLPKQEASSLDSFLSRIIK